MHKGATASIQAKSAHADLVAAGSNASWSIENTPIPVTDFTDLDRQHIEPRSEFLLTSPATAETQFLVGMNFAAGPISSRPELQEWSEQAGKGLRTTETGSEGASVVFRTGTGDLVLDRLVSDGSVLAQRGSGGNSWMAAGAKWVKEGGKTIFHSAAATDVAWQRANGATNLTIRSSAAGSVSIFCAAPPQALSIDGNPAAIAYQADILTLKLAPGEHHVLIR
jgi:hypothetical protein